MAITIDKLIGDSINITTTGGGSSATERWVSACNPDGSPLSDIEHAEWVFSDGGNHIITRYEYDTDYYMYYLNNWEDIGEFEYNGKIWYAGMPGYYPKTDNVTQLYWGYIGETDGEQRFLDIRAYRKYTPGHWEDADGNWINGSWEEWTVTFGGIIDENPVNVPQWVLDPENLGNTDYGWYNNGTNWLDNNENTPLIYKYEMIMSAYISYRTWNSTKPAPTT